MEELVGFLVCLFIYKSPEYFHASGILWRCPTVGHIGWTKARKPDDNYTVFQKCPCSALSPATHQDATPHNAGTHFICLPQINGPFPRAGEPALSDNSARPGPSGLFFHLGPRTQVLALVPALSA